MPKGGLQGYRQRPGVKGALEHGPLLDGADGSLAGVQFRTVGRPISQPEAARRQFRTDLVDCPGAVNAGVVQDHDTQPARVAGQSLAAVAPQLYLGGVAVVSPQTGSTLEVVGGRRPGDPSHVQKCRLKLCLCLSAIHFPVILTVPQRPETEGETNSKLSKP